MRRSLALALGALLVMTACDRSGAASAPSPFTIAATGDIACPTPPMPDDPMRRCQYDLVAELVKSLRPTRFLALGGEQYTFAGPPDYARRYDRYFGSLKPITDPVPGPMDWSDRAAYFTEFGKAAGAPLGSYSFDLGSWHVIALNSTPCFRDRGCGPGTPVYDWLSADLASHPNSVFPCTLAYFHDPRFLSVTWWERDGVPKGPEPRVFPLWAQLQSAGVDVVLAANAHNYERWAPQNTAGRLDPKHGITEFVVGTGGRRLLPLGPLPRPANLRAAQDTSYGVLWAQLGDGRMRYAWRSAPLQPTFQDAGTVRCH